MEFEAQPGFSVEEVRTVEWPEFERSERRYTCETEDKVVEHIVKSTTDLIARDQYYKRLKHRDQNPST